MEELLNKLIKRGWKPFGIRGEETRIKIERNEDLDMQIFKLDWIIIEQHHRISGSLRNLTSKESGLWQFVCENGIIENGKTVHDYVISHITYSYDKGCGGYAPNNSEFWIMTSALCDEDKLEQFLIDNIKVEGNEK